VCHPLDVAVGPPQYIPVLEKQGTGRCRAFSARLHNEVQLLVLDLRLSQCEGVRLATAMPNVKEFAQLWLPLIRERLKRRCGLEFIYWTGDRWFYPTPAGTAGFTDILDLTSLPRCWRAGPAVRALQREWLSANQVRGVAQVAPRSRNSRDKAGTYPPGGWVPPASEVQPLVLSALGGESEEEKDDANTTVLLYNTGTVVVFRSIDAPAAQGQFALGQLVQDCEDLGAQSIMDVAVYRHPHSAWCV
jgi:hypothetical protein